MFLFVFHSVYVTFVELGMSKKSGSFLQQLLFSGICKFNLTLSCVILLELTYLFSIRDRNMSVQLS